MLRKLVRFLMMNARLGDRENVTRVLLLLVMFIVVPLLNRLSAHYATEEWYLLDEGTIAYTAFRIVIGEIPHVDFPYFYAGGVEFAIAGLFSVLGESFGVARTGLVVCMMVTSLAVFSLLRKLDLDRVMAFMVSVVVVCVGFGCNFHIYPAWFAGALVLISYGLITSEKCGNIGWRTLLAGCLFGLAALCKQNTGILAFLGALLFAPYYLQSSSDRQETRNQLKTPRWIRALLGFPGLSPIVTVTGLLLLMYIIRMHLSLLNVAMFMILPVLVAIWGMSQIWRMRQNRPGDYKSRVEKCNSHILVVSVGFILGLLPLSVYYLFQGEFGRFFHESFLATTSLFERRFSPFKFADAEALGNPFLFLRRLLVQLIPHVAVILGLVIAYRRSRVGADSLITKVLLLNSCCLACLYFTQYPIALHVYVLYMLPMVSLPIGFAMKQYLARRIKSAVSRSLIVGSLAAIMAIGYIGSRSGAGDLGLMFSDSVVVLEPERGDILVPEEVREYVKDVIGYLKSRPRTERFLAFDVYNKAVGFVVGKRIEVDYLQRHYYSELKPSDYTVIMDRARERGIETIILGKKYLIGLAEEQHLLQFLSDRYTLALDTPHHLVYQATSHEQGR
jgi:hypothetical protein